MERILTKNVDKENSESIAVYEAGGGYQALAKALKMDPADVTEQVKQSGLRGRGGAGFPTGLKWTFMPKEVDPKRPHYLAVNADESEPGTFKDRLLMEKDPHLCIESFLISAYAIRAGTTYIYIRGEYVYPARVLERAIAEAYDKGYLGKNVLGSGWDHDMVVHMGAGAYICGEETALMTSLEGNRGLPRLKPPFPAQAGLWGCPTTVNNVETLCNVPFIVERGADWFKSIGSDERNTGPKLYSVSGHVKRPGNYEAPIGIPFMELLNDLAGGMLHDDRPLKAVIPGGSSVPVLRADECDVNMDYDALAAKGSMLGSAAVMVMDSSTDMVRAARNVAYFYKHESCGQCTPCRQGCGWIYRTLGKIENGRGTMEDLQILLDLADNIQGNTICALGDAAAMPCRAFVTKFRDEFEARIQNKVAV
jgi:NADH-quinone oxidoreductase subunit F